MAEIKITLGEIDYVNLVKVAFPMIKEKLQNEGGMIAGIIKHMNDPDEKTIQSLLALIPEKMRKNIIRAALEKYRDEIPEALMSFAEAKGLKLDITDIEINME